MLRLHGALADGIPLLKADLPVLIDALDNWDELHELRADLITQEMIHLQWVIGVGSVDRGQDVELHLVVL